LPIIENPPLARSLYRSVEVGQPIPVDLYAAVAAILAYLYRQRVEAELRERRAREAAAKRTRFFTSIVTLTAFLIFPDWPTFLKSLATHKIPQDVLQNQQTPA